MSTRNRDLPLSSLSSSSSSAKMLTVSENPTGSLTVAAKKQPALADVTNQRNGSKSNSRTLLPQSRSLRKINRVECLKVPCVVKIAKTKKKVSACTDKTGFLEKTLPTSLGLKSSVFVLSEDKCFPGSDQSVANAAVFSAPCGAKAGVCVLSSTIRTPRVVNISPCSSASGCISLDESMSTCESLKSPDFEYIDNEDAPAVRLIERKTTKSLFISENAEITRNVSEIGMLVNLETFDPVVDIDNNAMDPQCFATIACDIYKHLRLSEANKSPSTDFMERIQKDINASMRAVLIDWLVEVAEEYRLLPDALFLTVNYIDCYLSSNVVNRKQLQLLGVSCMMIAAKYEEICAPSVDEFCYVTDNTYSKEEVLQMEPAVLNSLKFEMTAPTTKFFLRRFVCVAHATTSKVPSMQLECLANYLTELSLLEYSMLRYSPSLVAASATFLAKFILFPLTKPWNSALMHYTRYQATDLSDCVKVLHSLCCNCNNLNLPAIREKYSQHKYKYVAKKYCPSIPQEFFQELSN